MADAWDQMEGESAKAYRAFTLYRDQGLTRTLIEAYRQYVGEKRAAELEPGHHLPGSFKKWVTDNQWRVRARAYDRDREDRLKRKRQAAEMQIMETLTKHGPSVAIRVAFTALGLEMPEEDGQVKQRPLDSVGLRAAETLLDRLGIVTPQPVAIGTAAQTWAELLAEADEDADEDADEGEEAA